MIAERFRDGEPVSRDHVLFSATRSRFSHDHVLFSAEYDVFFT
jgi:hypothetical protein